MKKKIAFGLKIALFNFVVLALLGSLMRYKMGFDFPYFIQKNLIDAHSHFAFYGWIAMAIYFLIVNDLKSKLPMQKYNKYFWVAGINLFASYGMLAAFTYKDYYWLSITFASVALFCGWAFLFMLYKDFKNEKSTSILWYLGALFFAFVSSIGIFTLSYLTATKQITSDSLLSSIYFYLHFQYNGFFLFSCIGLLLSQLSKIGVSLNKKQNSILFYSFFIGCLFTYGLSVLWYELPLWLYLLTIIGTVLQTFGSILLAKVFIKNRKKIKQNVTSLQRWVLFYVGGAFYVKIFLQLISIFPSISHYAFDYRNVTIAYLHLVLLACISVFLVSKIIEFSEFRLSKWGVFAFLMFLWVVLANQIYLGLSAFSSIYAFQIPHLQLVLFIFGILIAICLLVIIRELNLKKDKNTEPIP